MRHYSLALLGLLALAAGALAQKAAPPKPTYGTPEQLKVHLANWESEMSAVKSINAECSRTDVNKVRESTTQLSGYVKCLKVEAGGKVDKLALLYLSEKDKSGKEVPDAYEKLICTGAELYCFAPRQKTIFATRLGTKTAGDGVFDIIFQPKATALPQRYDLALVFPEGGEDKNYVYIEIKPRLDADKAEFQRARVVLLKPGYLPAQLWFEEPNGNRHTWELSKIKANNDAGVKATDFVAPEKPAGWTLEQAKDNKPEPRLR